MHLVFLDIWNENILKQPKISQSYQIWGFGRGILSFLHSTMATMNLKRAVMQIFDKTYEYKLKTTKLSRYLQMLYFNYSLGNWVVQLQHLNQI